MKLIGKGERSKVYQHEDDDKVLKITKYKKEKEVIEYFFKNPANYFVQIYNIEIKGSFIHATCEKVFNTSFTMKVRNSSISFFESYFNSRKYTEVINNDDLKEQYIINRINELDVDEKIVREYYKLLDQAYNDGLNIFDVAWNIGQRKDGNLVCYDAEF